MIRKLIESEDFYFNKDGLMVLTASYLKERGYCCKNDCLNCPYSDQESSNELTISADKKDDNKSAST